MRQRSCPPAHGGENLCGRISQRSRTAAPRSQRKYDRAVWANKTLALPGDVYVDGGSSVSPLARVSRSRSIPGLWHSRIGGLCCFDCAPAADGNPEHVVAVPVQLSHVTGRG